MPDFNFSRVQKPVALWGTWIYFILHSESMANESGHQTGSSLATPSLRPPRYSFVFQDTSAGAGRSPTNHAFSLPDEPTKGQLPWVTLHILQTRPSSRIQKYPRFLEGDNVSGTIDLNLLNPQTINTISVVVCFILLRTMLNRKSF